jgi:hypothetical protein
MLPRLSEQGEPDVNHNFQLSSENHCNEGKFAIIERGTTSGIVQFKTFDATVQALVAIYKRD